MERSTFEDEVLGMCGNDYEAPHTIASDLARELRRPVTESEVRKALLALASKGLVQAFVFENPTNRYVPISSGAATQEEAAWFLITLEGHHAHVQNAT